MKIKPKDKGALLKAARGEIKCDLLIRNIRLVNVITGEIYEAEVFVYDGMIAHVEYQNMGAGHDDAVTVLDGGGRYLIPGLIDAHEHIESSMMTPRNFAKAVIPHGTTTVITDPHEIANVWGMEGVRYMYEASEDLPMRQLIDIPSCVPAVPGLEHSGAEFGVPEIKELAELERVVGLAEVMDYLDVINGGDRMMNIIGAAEQQGLYLQGHAPFVSGRMLSAYLCGGPDTCHESRDPKEALEKLRSGMRVDARDSSIAKNVSTIWEGVKHCKFFDNLCLCTDDREADDILHHGHMNDVVRSAIRSGMEPVTAIKSATWNTAREARIENLGAIAPGYAADMLLVDSLEELKPSHVFFDGKLVAQDGILTAEIKAETYSLEKRNSMHVKALSEDDFKIPVKGTKDSARVHLMVYRDLELSTTEIETEVLPVKHGTVDLGGQEDLKYVAVINRYEGQDSLALGIVKGFGTKSGALAATVSHDCHNLTIVYEKPSDAYLAAKELINVGGGMCAVKDGAILHTLELPLAGLMSLKPAEELAADSAGMKDANRTLGLVDMENPLLRIVTLALPVIPEAKMSDMGLIQVSEKKIIPLMAEED